MFQIGELVIYGSHGVCQIASEEEHVINGKVVKYYVLQPLNQQGSRYMIPCENAVAMSKVRKVLTREEWEELLRSEMVHQFQWISDENARKLKYKELITSGDRASLLGMVYALHQHKKEQIASGKKFHQSDANFLNDAQKLLTSEISLVLQIEPESVGEYVLAAMEKQ